MYLIIWFSIKGNTYRRTVWANRDCLVKTCSQRWGTIEWVDNCSSSRNKMFHMYWLNRQRTKQAAKRERTILRREILQAYCWLIIRLFVNEIFPINTNCSNCCKIQRTKVWWTCVHHCVINNWIVAVQVTLSGIDWTEPVDSYITDSLQTNSFIDRWW